MRSTVSIALALFWVACDGSSETDAGGRDAGTALDAGGADAAAREDAGIGGDGGSDAGSGEDGGADAGVSDAGASDGGAADAGPSATVTVRDVAVYSNCQPVIGDPRTDPVLAFWTVDVRGASAATATLLDAKLTIAGTGGGTQSLTVDVASFALTGGAGSQEQRKTGADTTFEEACRALCTDASFSLELTFDVGGPPVVVVETDAFGCVH
ncbi:MAG: hypothetical protein KF729_15555 [Sandaracinaceae bacterium]|nr:hypothetical protein [Sandaracinaceae bacterium]